MLDANEWLYEPCSTYWARKYRSKGLRYDPVNCYAKLQPFHNDQAYLYLQNISHVKNCIPMKYGSYYHIVLGKRPWVLAAQVPKLRGCGYTEEVLKWFNYPHARAHPGCEVSCQGVPNQLASFLHSYFIEASPTVEKAGSCYKVDWLIAMLPSLQWSVIACSTRISCCRGRTPRTRPRMGVCEPLMPDVMATKAHQNNCNYVSSADLPSDSLCRI